MLVNSIQQFIMILNNSNLLSFYTVPYKLDAITLSVSQLIYDGLGVKRDEAMSQLLCGYMTWVKVHFDLDMKYSASLESP